MAPCPTQQAPVAYSHYAFKSHDVCPKQRSSPSPLGELLSTCQDTTRFVLGASPFSQSSGGADLRAVFDGREVRSCASPRAAARHVDIARHRADTHGVGLIEVVAGAVITI